MFAGSVYNRRMRYRNIIIVLGFLVVVAPLLHFPAMWMTALYTILGLAVIALAYVGKER